MSGGNTLRVVVAHRPPFAFAANGTGRPFYGLLVDLLDKIVASSNDLSYEMHMAPTNAGGVLTPAGWTGVVGELVAGRADVALFPLTRTAARLAAIDCTHSYMDQGLSVLVRNEVRGAGAFSVLAPFSVTLWVLLLLTVAAIACLFWALDRYGGWVRAQQAGRIGAGDEGGGEGDAAHAAAVRRAEAAAAVARKRERSHIMVSFMAAAGAPERPDRSTWGVQVLYVVYCFFCLIVLSAYTANLTAYLSVTRAQTAISGLQDLLRSGQAVGVNPNGSTAAYFAASHDTLATQLQPQVVYCATPDCLTALRSGRLGAFVSDQPLLAHLAAQAPCDLALVGQDFGPGNLVVGLRKGSPHLSFFNEAIQNYSEDGTLTQLRRAWFEGLSQCGAGPYDSSSAAPGLSNGVLGVTQLLGAFVFLLLGVVVAFATGTCENLKWCILRGYRRQQRLAQE